MSLDLLLPSDILGKVLKERGSTLSKKVKPEEISECYGKHRIDRGGGDSCSRRADCPWGESCLSLADEKAEAIHYHRAHLSLGDLLFDEETLAAANLSAPPAFAEAEPDKGSGKIILEKYAIPGGEYDSVCAALAEVAKMYFDTPTAFDCLMRKLYKNQKQADVAKLRGNTRQAINKRLLHELGIAQKRNTLQQQRERELEQAKSDYEAKTEALRKQDTFLAGLSSRNWTIYKRAFINGESREVIARELHIGTATVSRVIQFLRSNLNKSDTIKRGRKKKIAKK